MSSCPCAFEETSTSPVGLTSLDLRDFRNIEETKLQLAPGLNVFFGRNAQGKTALLEAVGLLARGRSFRTDEARSLIRRGSSALRAQGALSGSGESLELLLDSERRRFFIDGSEVRPAAYYGRLDVVLYAAERLPVVRGTMRDRRQFFDRGAAALWPSYRQLLRDYERVLRQRNAALERDGAADLSVWDDALVTLGARLRQRRSAYLLRLAAALEDGFVVAGETYGIRPTPERPHETEEAAHRALAAELHERRREEHRARRSLCGPHRDPILLTIDGVDTSLGASAGQARSLLLALTLATLEVHRQETGKAPLALLDDLDSELDDERAGALCRLLGERGQALVTTAHETWARRIASHGRTFHVASGTFTPV